MWIVDDNISYISGTGGITCIEVEGNSVHIKQETVGTLSSVKQAVRLKKNHLRRQENQIAPRQDRNSNWDNGWVTTTSTETLPVWVEFDSVETCPSPLETRGEETILNPMTGSDVASSH